MIRSLGLISIVGLALLGISSVYAQEGTMESIEIIEETDLQIIEPYTLDELFAYGGGGCGMSLLLLKSEPGQGFLFTHGIDEEPALIKVEGEWVRLERIETEGAEFYGQSTSQTFMSEDGSIRVQTEVTLGERQGEAIGFTDAILRVKQGDIEVEITVQGDAGC